MCTSNCLFNKQVGEITVYLLIFPTNLLMITLLTHCRAESGLCVALSCSTTVLFYSCIKHFTDFCVIFFELQCTTHSSRLWHYHRKMIWCMMRVLHPRVALADLYQLQFADTVLTCTVAVMFFILIQQWQKRRCLPL